LPLIDAIGRLGDHAVGYAVGRPQLRFFHKGCDINRPQLGSYPLGLP
jgi:hypothetical protein